MFAKALIMAFLYGTIKRRLQQKGVFILAKLDRLLDDAERLSHDGKSVLSRGEYTDKPILFTASQMKSFTPDRIMKMRRAFSTRSVYLADPHIFVGQAKMMEDFDDDCVQKTEYSSAFPSYAAMNTLQLRTYFTWRTKLRGGQLEKTSLSYAYVYIFELLNLVGASTPDEAFTKLRDFFSAYGELDPSVLVYRARWLTDFAVTYRLTKRYAELPYENSLQRSGAVLSQPDKYANDEILRAVEDFSSYSLMHSSSYKKNPALVARVAGELVKEVDRLFASSGGFVGHYCRRKKKSYFTFAGAVVESRPVTGCVNIDLPDGRSFYCLNGHWLATSFEKNAAASRDLGALIRCADIIIREKLKLKSAIKPVPLNISLKNSLSACVDRVFEQAKRQSIKKKIDNVKIDFSNVDAIRSASDITGEKLMTEEDKTGSPGAENALNCPALGADKKSGDEKIESALYEKIENALCKSDGNTAVTTDENAGCEKIESSVGVTDKNTAFEKVESSGSTVSGEAVSTKHGSAGTKTVEENDEPLWKRVLRLLLDGGNAEKEAAAAGIPISMVCDEINEMFYDEFCDIVIDFDGDKPFIISDYAEELRGKLT